MVKKEHFSKTNQYNTSIQMFNKIIFSGIEQNRSKLQKQIRKLLILIEMAT